jgi:rhodanese-related sulfurtransferase
MQISRRFLTIISVLLLAATGMVAYYTFYSPLWISAEDAKKALAERHLTTVLDVRTDLEYNLGHYPEAVHIPTAKLSEQLSEKLPNKNAGILVYCNTGQRSRHAADMLKAKGYKNVRYISGPYWSLLR